MDKKQILRFIDKDDPLNIYGVYIGTYQTGIRIQNEILEYHQNIILRKEYFFHSYIMHVLSKYVELGLLEVMPEDSFYV